MKKYGKFGKGTAPVAPVKTSEQKPPKVKNMLLQTYFTGLLCLILSVGMFLGTSYAWFTSEVTNTANEIYVGTLKVGLYKETDAGNKNLATDNVKLFEDSIRWEPGYTNLETIQVVNEGDLAFQYVLTFTDGSVDGANLYDVAQHFDVCVYNHHNKQDPQPASFDAIMTDDNWDKVGTLAQVLNGKVVLSGNMVSVREDGQDAAAINDGTTDGLRTTDRYTIALHMKESATSAVMGRKIKLNVKLVAYQKAQETDDMGTNTYDSDISVATDAESLTDALRKGGHVLLASNITLTNDVALGTATLDGNGHGITKESSSDAAVTASGGKISNLTIADRALQVDQLTSDLVVTNCTLNGTCSLNLGSESNGDVYFTNCTFDGEVLNVSVPNDGTTITLTNCTYDGRTIEKATITSSGATGGLKLEGNKVVLDSNS